MAGPSRLDRMRANPAADWSMDDVLSLCHEHGIRCNPPSGGGSHWKVSELTQRDILTIPNRRPVKAIYIRRLVRFVELVKSALMAKLEYPVIIEPLPESEGGGFVALVPDLPGCMSDGETAEAALAAVVEAIAAWIDEATLLGRPVPAPSRHLEAAE
jgi:antitoxin HicB